MQNTPSIKKTEDFAMMLSKSNNSIDSSNPDWMTFVAMSEIILDLIKNDDKSGILVALEWLKPYCWTYNDPKVAEHIPFSTMQISRLQNELASDYQLEIPEFKYEGSSEISLNYDFHAALLKQWIDQLHTDMEVLKIILEEGWQRKFSWLIYNLFLNNKFKSVSDMLKSSWVEDRYKWQIDNLSLYRIYKTLEILHTLQSTRLEK